MNQLASRIQSANTVLIADGKLDAMGDFFTPDYIVHMTGGGSGRGHDLVRGFLGALQRSFPDLEVEVEVLLTGEDRIAWQRTLSGTQEGAFQGFPASGRRIVWRDMVVSRLQDGLIAEEWVVTDLAEQLLRSRKG